MSTPAIRIETAQQGPVMVLKPVGWVAAEGHVALEERLKAAVREGQTRIVIDLSAAHFVSSTGLGVFLYYQKTLEEKGGRLILAAPAGAVKKMLVAANLDKALAICETLQAALARATRHPGSSRRSAAKT